MARGGKYITSIRKYQQCKVRGDKPQQATTTQRKVK
jgi:hypothetical protein